ncbi:MAG: GspH/FimT family pseudopilin [Gemmatimonadales bacterium]|jgi:type II secretory pathway pseudopilin PulG
MWITGKSPRANQHGHTLVEMLIVCVIFIVVLSVSLPRGMKTTPRQQLDNAARQLVDDLEQARTRAIATKRRVRVRFDADQRFYTAFVDVSDARTGAIEETEAEARESHLGFNASLEGIPGLRLPRKIEFGVGNASTGPLGGELAGSIGLSENQVEFDSRGMVFPLGAGGTIYVAHEENPDLVAAVTISGMGAFRAWHFRDGEWARR